jgi:hypothetical protein
MVTRYGLNHASRLRICPACYDGPTVTTALHNGQIAIFIVRANIVEALISVVVPTHIDVRDVGGMNSRISPSEQTFLATE